jgi:flavin reductase (DIM6/NTAB) family NADH-FMN oxidoreductase RutF
VSDHTLVIGRVEQAIVAEADEPGRPLIYFNRTFHSLGEPIDERED